MNEDTLAVFLTEALNRRSGRELQILIGKLPYLTRLRLAAAMKFVESNPDLLAARRKANGSRGGTKRMAQLREAGALKEWQQRAANARWKKVG